MKKLAIIITSLSMLIGASNAFAAITAKLNQPSNGEDYVGKVVAATYDSNLNGQPEIQILSVHDGKNDSNLPSLYLTIDGKDLPFGMILATAIGKKIAVYGSNLVHTNPDIQNTPIAEIKNMLIVTDDYWYGQDSKLKK